MIRRFPFRPQGIPVIVHDCARPAWPLVVIRRFGMTGSDLTDGASAQRWLSIPGEGADPNEPLHGLFPSCASPVLNGIQRDAAAIMADYPGSGLTTPQLTEDMPLTAR